MYNMVLDCTDELVSDVTNDSCDNFDVDCEVRRNHHQMD